MKIFYIANTHIPTGKAHGIQIMEMCQAWGKLGHEVELAVRATKERHLNDNPFEFYDVAPNFKIKNLPSLDLLSLGRIGFWLQSVTFALSVFLYSFGKSGMFYTRDELVAVILFAAGKQVAWEAHMGHDNLWVRLLIKSKSKMVVITDALKDLYASFGLPREKILVAADGADIDRFDIDVTKREAREKLNLPQDKKIVLYKGSLIPYKGAGTLAEAARFAKTTNVAYVFIGGNPEEVDKFKNDFGKDDNLLIIGKVHRKLTPIYQKAADLLVIPNSAKEDMSKLYTSPLKLFGYMAGKVPIVASDLPSIREVLDESRAYFAEADNPQSFGEAIDGVFGDYKAAEAKALKAFDMVKNYSWTKRAESILNFLHA